MYGQFESALMTQDRSSLFHPQQGENRRMDVNKPYIGDQIPYIGGQIPYIGGQIPYIGGNENIQGTENKRIIIHFLS